MNDRTQTRAESEAPTLMPPVDVIEDASGITLSADLPSLVIEGELALEMPKNLEATHVEVSLPRYRRVFTLSKELDPERLSAELKHGALKLQIQKAEHAKPKRVAREAALRRRRCCANAEIAVHPC
jgi:HSP20 family protein